MWAQLMKMRLKPEKEQDLAGVFKAVARIGTTRVGSASDDDHEGSERPEPGLRLGRFRK